MLYLPISLRYRGGAGRILPAPEKGTVPICAEHPEGRSSKWGLSPFPALPEELGFRRPRVVLPGILVVEGPPYKAVGPACRAGPEKSRSANGTYCPVVERFCGCYHRHDVINGFPLVVVVDESEFAARTLENFLWTTFTRSNPAADVYGIEPFFADKHWGCFGSLVIDARAKPHHAPPVVEDPAVTRRVDALAARGGPLHGLV